MNMQAPIQSAFIPNYDVRAEVEEAIADIRAGRRPQRTTYPYVTAYCAELSQLPRTASGYIDWSVAPSTPEGSVAKTKSGYEIPLPYPYLCSDSKNFMDK